MMKISTYIMILQILAMIMRFIQLIDGLCNQIVYKIYLVRLNLWKKVIVFSRYQLCCAAHL